VKALRSSKSGAWEALFFASWKLDLAGSFMPIVKAVYTIESSTSRSKVMFPGS
jgi:hypothetical protein